MMSRKKWSAAFILLGIGILLNAAALPDGWNTYLSGAPQEKAKCSITAVKGGIKIVDGSPRA
ncbi:MAG: hypothetical protein IKD46_00995, partial [Lentisphaeria bacterium]|nr:hypothetical protein [Lentisphaeria bacterium]